MEPLVKATKRLVHAASGLRGSAALTSRCAAVHETPKIPRSMDAWMDG